MKSAILVFLFYFSSIIISFAQGFSLPYYTGFDSPAEQAGWQEFRLGNDSTAFKWKYDNSQFFSSPNSLFHDYNVGGSAADTVIDWFVSPPLNFTSMGKSAKLSLKIMIGGPSSPYPDSFEIWFGGNNPNPTSGSFMKIANLSYMQPMGQWLDTTINIPSITDSGYIAFRYKTIDADWLTFSVDNIIIRTDSVNENPRCDSLTLKADTFYFINFQDTLELTHFYSGDITGLEYPLIRLELQDTTIISIVNDTFISATNFPDTLINNFILNYKTTSIPVNYQISGKYIWECGGMGFTCEYPITIILNNGTGIKKNDENKNEIKISPNPFTNSITIKINNPPSSMDNLQFTIYNLLGKKVFQKIINNQSTIINTPNLPTGLYIYTLKTAQETMARGKIIKQ